jgi:hypothetical protein
MDGLHVDVSELTGLARDLDAAPEKALADTRAVVQRGALNIKKDAQKRVTGLKHAPAYPRSIGYDTHTTLTGASAEIGPDKEKRQGALGNLIEYGSIHNPPRPHLAPALEAEEPRFVKALEEVAAKAAGL